MIRQKDCSKCIHHTSGSCSAWECDFVHYRTAIIEHKQIELIKGYLEAGGKDIDEIKRFFLYGGEDE